MDIDTFEFIWAFIDDVDALATYVDKHILEDAKASWIMALYTEQHERSPCATCGYKIASRCACAQKEHFGRTCFKLYAHRDQMFPRKK